MPRQDDVPILVADSVTKLDARHRGAVLIGGSHGGVYAAYLAAKAGVRGVLLNDAGVGKDGAGIACLDYFAGLGRPAATIGHDTARIGDGEDMARRGIVSHVNVPAAELGCVAGEPARWCAERMRRAGPPGGEPPPYAEARFRLCAEPGKPEVWGLDSISLLRPEDRERIIVAASHGAVLRGAGGKALRYPVRAAVFNDAGVGIECVGIGRLAAMDKEGVPGATVGAMSARIGDARSSWETGVISHVNGCAAALGASPGISCRDFVALVLAAAAGA